MPAEPSTDAEPRRRPYLDPNDPASWARVLGTQTGRPTSGAAPRSPGPNPADPSATAPLLPPGLGPGERVYIGPNGEVAPILARPAKPKRSAARLVALWIFVLLVFIVAVLISLSWARGTTGG